MKLLKGLTAVLILCLCATNSFSQEKVKVKDGKMKVKGATTSTDLPMMPYTADYTSNFTLGNQHYAAMVLDLWKDYDNNNFSAHDYFADSIKVTLSNGMEINGKEQMMKAIGGFRSSMTSASSTIHAYVPLHSVDRNDDLVAIWGQESRTFPDGKSEVTELHEVWFFNKDGKVYLMRQWESKPFVMKH